MYAPDDPRDTESMSDDSCSGDPATGRVPATFLRGSAVECAAPLLERPRAQGENADDSLASVRRALAHRYDVVQEVGRGGMAVVYLARDHVLGRDVAIKVLREYGLSTTSVERFAREVAIVATLQHPHIVPLYESGTSDGIHYFVMPHVVGDTLRELLRREGALSLPRVVALVQAIASALDFAHGHGVIHRDVKPGNVLLLPDGTAMLADFGIALARDADAMQLTDPGHVPGTPAYMPPEAAGGGGLTPASDVYSLALVAREALTATPTCMGDADGGAGVRASRSSSAHTLPAPVASVLARALAPDPRDRLASASAFAAALAGASAAAPLRPRRGVGILPLDAMRVSAMALLGTLASGGAESGSRIAPREVPGATDPAPRRVAVLPLEARVPQALRERELGEAIVLPLSMQLDASAELETVDHAAVIARRRASGAARSAEELASTLGATDYVTGSIVGIGGRRIGVFLTLQPVARGAREPASVEASGDADRLIELVDSLARRLLVGLVPHPYRETASIAERTTRSNAALLVYLEGERHYRARRYDSASVLFNRAIETDSTFALAMHRLRVAHNWTPIALPVPRDLRQRMLRHAARLPARQRQHALAYDAFDTGRPFEAESIYTALLAEHPHDIDALFHLATVLIHYHCNWGYSFDAPQRLLEQVLRIDPTHAGAVEKLAMIASARMRPAASESLLARLSALERGEYRLVTRAARAFLTGNHDEQRQVMAALDTAHGQLLRMAVHRAGGAYPGHLRARIRMAELLTRPHRTREDRATGYLMIADLEMARGRIGASDRARMSAARVSPDAMLEGLMRVFIAAPAFELRSRQELHDARALVEGARRAGATDSVRQRFLLGVFDARLADLAAARAHAAVLDDWSRRLADSAARLAGVRELQRAAVSRRGARLASLAVSLRADVERRRGDPRAALALLGEWHPERWWTFALFDQVRAQAYERHLYATILEANGRYEEAVRWYEAWNGPLIGTAQSTFWRLRMGHLLEERLGRPEEAIDAYAKVIDAWDDAAPVLAHWREDARRRALRLQTMRAR